MNATAKAWLVFQAGNTRHRKEYSHLSSPTLKATVTKENNSTLDPFNLNFTPNKRPTADPRAEWKAVISNQGTDLQTRHREHVPLFLFPLSPSVLQSPL